MKFKNIIVLLIVLPLVAIAAKPVLTEELEINPLQMTSWREQVAYFSKLYGADYYLVERTIYNESNGSHTAVGDGGYSRGIGQIQEPTWRDLEYKYNKEFKEDLNYKSQFDQIKLTTWSIANGYGNKWTAYRCIKNGGKYSFYSSQLKKHFVIKCKL